MKTHNANNERIKHRYFTYLREARGYSPATVDAAAKALDRFSAHTGLRDFKQFHYQQAAPFKRHLAEQRSVKTGVRLSKSTQHATLMHLRRFFTWLADQPGFRAKIKYSHAEYFNFSEKDTRIATARRSTKGPTLEQLTHVIRCMPTGTDIERRDRALVALITATAARNLAVTSLKLKHVDIMGSCVFQDAREVKTKNSKTFRTWFFPVGDEILSIIGEWVVYLRSQLLFGDDDPLFPTTLIVNGKDRRFAAAGLSREPWRTTAPICKVFRAAFERGGLAYANPHSVRNTLARFGTTLCRNAEEFKAWSQNLGHESPMTTFRSYGEVSQSRQEEIIRGLGDPQGAANEEIAEILLRKLREGGIGGVALCP